MNDPISPSSVQLTYYAEMEEFKRNWMGKQEEKGFSPDRLRSSIVFNS